MRRHIALFSVVGMGLGVLLMTLPASAAPTRYEAESATISQGVVESSHLNFSGTGYVNNDNLVGSYTQWTVNAVDAGTATLTIRYANGTTTARPADISVNGTVVAAGASFGSTTNWDTWANKTITAAVRAGSNTVRVTGTSSAGPPNLDYLDFDVATAPPPAVAYQAENATLSQGAVATSHTGFTGTGFVDYANVTGGYIEWTVNAVSAGSQTLTLRYANGATVNRPMTITVNGTAVATNLAFNPTTNWDTWADKTMTATLNAGNNTIRATATAASGGPNVDQLSVTGTIDTQAPSVPGMPSQVSITSTSVTVAWGAATDNAGVASYDIVSDGRLCGTVSAQNTTGTCTGLTPDTTAGISVMARDVAGNVSQPSQTLTVHTPAAGPGNPYGDPNLVSMFNGTTLDGWTQSRPDGWIVKNGAIHGTGAGRGWIYYNPKQVGTFRWIFTLRQVVGDHAPTVLIWGTTRQPFLDALGAIQFQPPNGGHWDYRPGHNNGGGSLFTQLPHTKIDIHVWSQCEIIGNQNTGVARMACCPLTAGAATCRAVEVLRFRDPTAGRVGPLAIQIHNSGIQDEYKNLYLESPVVTNPDSFITT
jgi:predicted secreted protein